MQDFFEEQFGDMNDGQDQPMEPTADLALAKKKKSPVKKTEGQLTVDVYQTEDDIIIRSTIAGVTAQDIDISITNDMVTIKGERHAEDDIKNSDYYYQELYWGKFSRSIILPEEIDSDSASATMKNGILTLRLPKMAKKKIKKVKIVS